MPRRRPGALRAAAPAALRWDAPPPERIHGLSTATSLAIHRAEATSTDDDVFPGATGRALSRYRDFLMPPGRRPRYPRQSLCPCRGCSLEDVRHARDVLETVLARLPDRARAELGRRVARRDAAYLARTLPDPFAADRQWRADLWWRRRLADGQEGG